jgi:hypothetical protein
VGWFPICSSASGTRVPARSMPTESLHCQPRRRSGLSSRHRADPGLFRHSRTTHGCLPRRRNWRTKR